jgi:hypothetical protein
MVNTSVKNVSSTSSNGNLVLSLSLLIGFCLFLQGTYLSQNYFITVAKDSMACKQVNFFDTNAQGKMIDLEYVTEQNDTVRLSKKDIPEIYKICQDGVIYLRMPLQLSDPDGYYRYGKRVVKGKITVDVYDDVQTMYRLKENFDGSYNAQGVMKQTTEGTYLRHVTLPNGSVYEISGLKALKGLKVIQKFMFECDEYEKEYFSNPKYQTCTFEEAVSDYNVMCP